ncbi:MAG: outer rane transport energization protein TonB [Acidobacteriaceae bacterium]|nr:outer rane transport energization protein TonB [Acidobacteriaceae bacterium]
MFADSLCDAHWDNQSHRGWTTLLSFGLQALAITILLALPFLYTQGLPAFLAPPRLLVPISERRAVQPQAPASNRRWVSIVAGHPFVYRRSETSHAVRLPEIPNATPPDISVTGPGSTGAGGPAIEGVSLSGAGLPVVIPHPPVSARHLFISHMMEGNLIHRVEPSYPAIARQARIQGIVLLRATISKDGTIENLQLLSGHPMLAQAAIEAVSQWRYRPYYLNGDPAEVETQVTVKFTLSGS